MHRLIILSHLVQINHKVQWFDYILRSYIVFQYDIFDDELPTTSRTLSQEVYIKACLKLRLVPSTYFFHHLKDVILCMPHHGMGPNGAKAVAIALVVNKYLIKYKYNH